MISEQISDVSANGVALDAGIQYRTGVQDELKFGISFKNWGPECLLVVMDYHLEVLLEVKMIIK